MGIIILAILIFLSLKLDNIQKYNRVNLLMSLFEQLKNGENSKDVKHWIDSKLFEEELQQLDVIKNKKLFEFCQFFELLTSFENSSQIKIMELKITFNPYFKAMKECETCRKFINQNEFTNLSNFLSENEF